MITVVKQDPQGNTMLRYQGEVIKRLPREIIIRAGWTLPAKDLGYARFEPGDTFTEYYYADRWFNIFDITSADNTRKGWYCNVGEPAVISQDRIAQIDLFLDVWVAPQGNSLILDEDEFATATTLSEAQRQGAREGLQALLQMIEARQEIFAEIVDNS
ncbi:DUF402 domain-containing protein [Ktedonosporobacter rubrisoli]|nr:DUF402 domain-containing protein [Ktedonosporobacter rubrisoli]